MSVSHISMGYRIDAAPPHMTRADVYRSMLDAIRDGTGKLPDGIRVTWSTRGKETPFETAVRNSNNGFRMLMERRVARDSQGVE